MVSMYIRAGLGLMTLFLLLAAAAQLNDPDSLLWIMVYGVPALLTLCAFVRVHIMRTRMWWYTCFGVFITLLAFSSLLITYYVNKQKFTWNVFSTEEGRESGGLFIVLLWLVILLSSSSTYNQIKKGNSEKYVFFAFGLVPLATWIGYKYFLQHLVDIPEHCQGVL